MSIINEKIKIDKIYHLADIHIRNDDSRTDEYKTVFNNLIKEINNDKNENENVLIVVAGDIVHNKTVLRPICIELTSLFFKQLLTIGEVIVIPGNHDCNISNPKSMNALKPIINHLNYKHNNKIHLLEKTGIYYYGNLQLGHTSIFSNYVINPEKNNKYKKIALYHGTLHGSTVDNETKLTGIFNNKDFKKWDWVLLGDIHKHQYLNNKKTIAYSSSLIQQNYGENLTDHGMIIWNLNSNTSIFKKIYNPYGFVSVNFKEGKCVYEPNKFPKYSRLRVIYSQMKRNEVENEIEKIKKKHNIIDTVVCREFDKSIPKSFSSLLNNSTNKNNSERSVIDFLIDKIRKSKILGKEEVEPIIKIIEDLVKELGVYEQNCKTLNLDSLQFDNLFGFGKNNEIKFSNWSKIVGLIAPNGYGKSSLVDTILYSIFDKFTSGDRTDVVNIKTKRGTSNINFRVNNDKYNIQRGITVSGNNQKRRRYDISINKNEKNITEDGKSLSNQQVERDICNYQDVLDTAIIPQNSITFTDLDNRRKKDYIYKLFNLDILDQIYKKARYHHKSLLHQYTVYQNEFNKAKDKVDYDNYQELLKKKEKIKGSLNVKRLYPELSLNQLLVERNKINPINYNNNPENGDLDANIFHFYELEKELETNIKNLNNNKKKKDIILIDINEFKNSINELYNRKKDLENKINKRKDKKELALNILEWYKGRANVMEQLNFNEDCKECNKNIIIKNESINNQNKQEYRIKKFKRRLEKSQNKIKQINQEINNLEYKFENSQNELNNISNCIENLEEKNKNIKEELKNLENKIENIKTKKAIDLDEEIENVEKYGEMKNNIYFDWEEINRKIAVQEEWFNEVNRLNQELTKINNKKEMYNNICKVIDKDGVVDDILNNHFLKNVQSNVNNILGDIAGFFINIRYDNSGVKVHKILANRGHVNSNRLSGYEKFITNVVLKIVFNQLNCRLKTDFIIIDEGFSSCDNENVNKLKPLYEYLRRNFKWCLVISHIESIKDNFDQIINVDQENGFSLIKG
jgi:DNA repair exonuclease SbcCD ATPase subunit